MECTLFLNFLTGNFPRKTNVSPKTGRMKHFREKFYKIYPCYNFKLHLGNAISDLLKSFNCKQKCDLPC